MTLPVAATVLIVSDAIAGGESARTRASADPSESRQEQILDEALEETFPASDPISPMVLC